ncbi:MAG: GtrA family protein [Chromatiales bacterium]|nr:GtrA family protein [Chromatiales bacterium]MCK7579219.1 GtrA family protein [Chromatiales bacterium]
MKWHIQFSRYALVGIASNALGYLLYLLLTYFGIGHKSAMTLLYAIGMAQTFHFNRRWSFGHKGDLTGAFARYVIVYGLGYLLNFLLLWIGVDQMHLPHQGVQAVAIVAVAVSLFLMHRYWVFASTAVRRAT